MRHLRQSFVFIALVLAVAVAVALTQRPSEPAGASHQADKSPPLDRKIPPMLKEISSRNIERSIREQVSFGTRHTLSSQTDPERGIGAARDWIVEEIQRYAAESGGRLTVELQRFVQPATPPRIPEPTTITNVVATLPGTQPESTDRVYVVSGHYDSRCTDPNDAICDAPGANDDASGVAAVLEAARVMSKRQFDATIVFMAVAGEEQGLFGSAHFAEQAQAERSGHRGDVHQRHRGQLGLRPRHARPVQRAALRRGRADQRDAAAGGDPALHRWRERRAVPPAGAVHQGGTARTSRRRWKCG